MTRCVLLVILAFGSMAVAQDNPAAGITANHAVTEADGTVRVQRVVPLPQGLRAD